MSTRVFLVLAFVSSLAACSGGEKPQTPAAGASTSAATPPTTGLSAMPATGATHSVSMAQSGNDYQYHPANITVKAGDAITFTVESGLPHNVSFWPDSIPPGAQAQLQANMGPNTIGPLQGPLLTTVGATYTLSFAGVPPGIYKMYCTPHLAYGMKGTITVQ